MVILEILNTKTNDKLEYVLDKKSFNLSDELQRTVILKMMSLRYGINFDCVRYKEN